MNNPSEPRQSRREVFRNSARYVAAGGLALLTGKLLLQGSASSADTRCDGNAHCDNCPVLVSCRLPQAIAATKYRRR